MKKSVLSCLVFLLSVVIPVSVCLAEEKSNVPEFSKILLPARTVIFLKLTNQLEGGKVKVGQEIDLEVARDIIFDQYILIARGAPAYGTITTAEEANFVSIGGKIGISIEHCQAADRSQIALKSILQEEGKSTTGWNIAGSVCVCPLILLIRGDEAVVPAGTLMKAYVESDNVINVKTKDKLGSAEIDKIRELEAKEEKLRQEKQAEKGKKPQPEQ